MGEYLQCHRFIELRPSGKHKNIRFLSNNNHTNFLTFWWSRNDQLHSNERQQKLVLCSLTDPEQTEDMKLLHDVPQNSEENSEEAAIDEQALNEDGYLDVQEGSTSTDVPQNPQQIPEEAAIDDGCSGESKNKKKRANNEARLDDWLTKATSQNTLSLSQDNLPSTLND